jgi:hypothetical protein
VTGLHAGKVNLPGAPNPLEPPTRQVGHRDDSFRQRQEAREARLADKQWRLEQQANKILDEAPEEKHVPTPRYIGQNTGKGKVGGPQDLPKRGTIQQPISTAPRLVKRSASGSEVGHPTSSLEQGLHNVAHQALPKKGSRDAG